MHCQQTQLLVLSFFFVFFVVLEESLGCGDDLMLVDAPEVFEVVDHLGFFVQGLQDLLVGNIVQPQDTVADSSRLEDLNPPDLVGVVAMGAAAGLDVDALDVDDSDSVAWDDTALIEVESVLGLSLLLAFEVLSDGVTLQDDPIGFVFDFHLNFLADGGVMSDIQVSILFSFLGSVLPDMRTKDSSRSSVHDVGACVECSQGIPSLDVDFSVNGGVDRGLDWLVKVMKEAFADFFDVDDLIELVPDGHGAQIVDLTSGCGIEGTAIKDNNILAFFLLFYILDHCDKLPIEFSDSVVLVVEILRFGVGNGIVEDEFGSLGGLFDPVSDLSIEVVGDGDLADLGDGIGRNTPALHGHNPVVDSKLALVLGNQLLELLLLG